MTDETPKSDESVANELHEDQAAAQNDAPKSGEKAADSSSQEKDNTSNPEIALKDGGQSTPDAQDDATNGNEDKKADSSDEDLYPHHKWYVVQARSSCENRARNSLLKKIENEPGMSDLISEVLVPEEKIEERTASGRKRIKVNKLLAGYVLIRMEMSKASQLCVQSVDDVIKFIPMADNVPQPLTEEQAQSYLSRIKGKGEVQRQVYEVGDTILVKSGPFADTLGTVKEVSSDKVNVMIEMFGRQTECELGYDQITKEVNTDKNK